MKLLCRQRPGPQGCPAPGRIFRRVTSRAYQFGGHTLFSVMFIVRLRSTTFVSSNPFLRLFLLTSDILLLLSYTDAA
jgi:hypothetical protein